MTTVGHERDELLAVLADASARFARADDQRPPRPPPHAPWRWFEIERDGFPATRSCPCTAGRSRCGADVRFQGLLGFLWVDSAEPKRRTPSSSNRFASVESARYLYSAACTDEALGEL